MIKKYLIISICYFNTCFSQINLPLNNSNFSVYDIIFHNPAGIAYTISFQGSIGTQLMWRGLSGDNLSSSFFTLSHQITKNLFIGLRGIYFDSNIFQEGNASILLGRKFFNNKLGVGLNTNLLYYNYSREKFHLKDYNDPIASGIHSINTFSFGFGFLYRPFLDLIFGASIDHINSPDISLDNSIYRKALIYKIGSIYKKYSIKPQLDLMIENNDITYQGGLYYNINKYLNIFACYNYSGKNQKEIFFNTNFFLNKFGLNYNYQYPLSELNQITNGNHLFAIQKKSEILPDLKGEIDINILLPVIADSMNDIPIVYDPRLTVYIKIIVNNLLESIQVNLDKTKIFGTSFRGIDTNQYINNNMRINLNEGFNTIVFSIKDKYDNVLNKSFKIIKEYPKENWAVVIGISDYKSSRISRLEYADDDAECFYNWLIDTTRFGGKYSKDKVTLLKNDTATKDRIINQLNVLKNAHRQDMVIIYYSGHGMVYRSKKFLLFWKKSLFLTPWNTDIDNFEETALSFDILKEIIKDIKARQIMIIIDACHSGNISDINKMIDMMKKLPKDNDNIILWSASDKNQLSWESNEWRYCQNDGINCDKGHGVFTCFMLYGLYGKADYNTDSTITFGELSNYVSENVRSETGGKRFIENRVPGSIQIRLQTPIVVGRFQQSLFILQKQSE